VRRASLLAAALVLCCPAALRAIPQGGLFGGPVRPNGASMSWNPAAVTALGQSWAALAELNGIALGASYSRAGADPNTGRPYQETSFTALAPNLSFTLAAPSPWKWLRFVAGGFSPVAASVAWPDDSPGRYSATSATLVAYAVPVGLLFTPSERFGVAVAAGPMYGLLDTQYHLDFGAFANGKLPPGSQPIPLEDPQLEGKVRLTASGWDGLVTAGVWAQPLDGLRLGLGVVKPFGLAMHGTARVQSSPSLAQALPGFQIDSQGDLSLTYKLAWQLQAEAEWRAGRWCFALLARDVTTHVHPVVPASITNASVKVLDGDQTSVSDLRDSFTFGLRGSREVGERWEVGARVDWLPTSVPAETMNTGNLDFDLLEVTAGVRMRFGAASALELSYMYVHGFDRNVTNSIFNPYAPPDSGLASPSGNGRYGVGAHMVTLSWIGVRPPAREAPRPKTRAVWIAEPPQ
jgi:long-subunit fatty acid transport protein